MADKPMNLFIDATFKLTKTLLAALVFSNWSHVPWIAMFGGTYRAVRRVSATV